MTETLTRAQAIENGVLVDISDIAITYGFHWPMAISQTLEDRILLSLPKLGSAEAIEVAFIAAISHVLSQASETLQQAFTDPAKREARRLPLALSMPWSSFKADDDVLAAVLLFGPDEASKPCFSLLAPGDVSEHTNGGMN